MTALTPTAAARGRILNVVRMQFVNRMTFVWIPLIILGGALALTLAIFALARAAGGDVVIYAGGAQAPLWYFAVAGAQSLTLTFPFSQAMSVTRRDFHLGTMLTATITSAFLSVLFVLGGAVELATHGWGMDAWMFAMPWVWASGPAGAFLFYFGMAMLFFLVGFTGATVYKRSGALGLTLTLIGVALLLVGGMWLIGMLNAWVAVFTWIAVQGAASMGAWMLVAAAVLAAASYAMLRRLVP